MGHPFEKPADVYAFGIIMWELLTWQIPWEHEGPWQASCSLCHSSAGTLLASDLELA